jgi:hypothetical protein
MLTPAELYPVIVLLLQTSGLVGHASGRARVARLVAALLVAQDLRPSALIRILPAPCARAARHRYASVRRALRGPWLTSAALTPGLVRAALAWVRQVGPTPAPGCPWLLALDSVRCGPWEVFTVGLVVCGRALPLAWSVLPYPWPRGQFRPTVDRLVARVLRSWPAVTPVCLLADRAFPSTSFFQTLARAGADWTVRLQARQYVTDAHGTCRRIRDLLATADAHEITIQPVTWGKASGVSGWLVIAGRGLLVVPEHQRGPASLAIRARQHHKRHKDRARRRIGTNQGPQRDEWLVLFTTAADARTALRQYLARWAAEGSYRDLQGGWDGQHGWHFDRVVDRRSDAAEVDGLVGLWAVGTLVQIGLGVGLTAPEAPAAVRQAPAGWATTNRLSWWWRGKCVLESPDRVLRAWTLRYLTGMATVLERAPAAIVPFERPNTDEEEESMVAAA